MPQIDKPLEELKTYRGISPKPADFDDYWAAALRELEAKEEVERAAADAERAHAHATAALERSHGAVVQRLTGELAAAEQVGSCLPCSAKLFKFA
jgi:cephalosporin-C deacetylase-like acetyl esterase